MRIRLIHWNAVEAKERAASLGAAGYDVVCEAFGPDGLRELKQELPAGVVIDLGRLPAQGRDVGLALRHAKATRHVPLVFVAGDPEKLARIQEHLPDAVYTTSNRIRGSLKRAIATPLVDPVVPAWPPVSSTTRYRPSTRSGRDSDSRVASRNSSPREVFAGRPD